MIRFCGVQRKQSIYTTLIFKRHCNARTITRVQSPLLYAMGPLLALKKNPGKNALFQCVWLIRQGAATFRSESAQAGIFALAMYPLSPHQANGRTDLASSCSTEEIHAIRYPPVMHNIWHTLDKSSFSSLA